MTMRTPLLAPALIAALLVGCSSEVNPEEPTPGVRATFDPATGAIPLPSDVLRNQDTGLLSLPVDPKNDSKLTVELKKAFNTLDGWLTTSTITIPFSQPLDPATVNDKTVLLFDVTDSVRNGGAAKRISGDKYFVVYDAGPEPSKQAPYWITVKNKSPGIMKFPTPFVQGHKYAVVVTDQVHGADGLPVIQTPAVHMLMSQTPLVDEDGHSTTILPDADMQQLEKARRAIYAPAALALEKATGMSRHQFVTMAAFSVQSGPRPDFDPTPTGNVLPKPNWKDKDVAVDVVPEVGFDLPYAPKSVVPGRNCFYWKVNDDGSLKALSFHVETTDKADQNGKYVLRFHANDQLQSGTSYQIAITDGVVGTTGSHVQPQAFFSLVSVTQPLLDGDKNLNSPLVDFALDVLILLGKDPSKASKDDWKTAYTMLKGSLSDLEKLRKMYQPWFEAAEAAGLERNQIRVMWRFTTKKEASQ